uniref:Uncharacterized protein n=1 Tax=Panagrolaimus superbus TaxID=310955 RepID=A0A914YK35_9BILA
MSTSTVAEAAATSTAETTTTTTTLPPQISQSIPPHQPSAILASNDGTFRLDLTSFNLSPHDLATITAAFNSTINSSTTTISALTTPNVSFNDTLSSNASMPTSMTSELVMKQKPKTRRQRAKHAIVPEEILIHPENVPGTFLNVNQQEFDELVNDNESALAFAAKVGLIQNIRKCPKCERDMALCKFNNSCGYRWVCRRTENGKRFTCSVRGMRKDTILDDRLVGILTMLRIMFNFAKNVSDPEIINRLDIGHVRSARSILSRLRDMVDEEVLKLSTDSSLTGEQLRHHFLTSEGLDQFGFILFWGTRYKSDKSSAASDEKFVSNNNNMPAASNMVIKEEPMTESMDVKEEATTTAIVTSQNVVKYETESESNEEVSTSSCSTAKENEEPLKS